MIPIRTIAAEIKVRGPTFFLWMNNTRGTATTVNDNVKAPAETSKSSSPNMKSKL